MSFLLLQCNNQLDYPCIWINRGSILFVLFLFICMFFGFWSHEMLLVFWASIKICYWSLFYSFILLSAEILFIYIFWLAFKIKAGHKIIGGESCDEAGWSISLLVWCCRRQCCAEYYWDGIIISFDWSKWGWKI